MLKALRLKPDSAVSIATDRRRRTLTFRDTTRSDQTFRVTVTRYAAGLVQTVRRVRIVLRPGRSQVIPYGKLR